MIDFEIKDSGERKQFESGMVRDTAEDKIDFLNIRFGPMFRRWASHLTKAKTKYPDVTLGVPNWTLATGEAELQRFRESFARHAESWLAGETDEDHAAAIFFNVNGAEYVRARLTSDAGEPLVCVEPGPTVNGQRHYCTLAEGHGGCHNAHDETSGGDWSWPEGAFRAS